MKKIIFIAILLIPSYALALGAGFAGLSAGASGAAACSITSDETLLSYTVTATTKANVYTDYQKTIPINLTGSGTYKVTEVDLYMAYDFAAVGETVTANIETDNSGKPSGTLVDANATLTLSRASFPAVVGASDCEECVAVTFTFPATITLNYGTTYWLRIISNANSASDYYLMTSGDGSGWAGTPMATTNGGTSWINNTTSDYVFAVRGCP